MHRLSVHLWSGMTMKKTRLLITTLFFSAKMSQVTIMFLNCRLFKVDFLWPIFSLFQGANRGVQAQLFYFEGFQHSMYHDVRHRHTKISQWFSWKLQLRRRTTTGVVSLSWWQNDASKRYWLQPLIKYYKCHKWLPCKNYSCKNMIFFPCRLPPPMKDLLYWHFFKSGQVFTTLAKCHLWQHLVHLTCVIKNLILP